MKKGFIATLIAAAIALSGSAFAAAPTILSLPDITIGDQEDNLGGSDNNYFVFTNAFKFDDHVVDSDTAVSSLVWSFDEHDALDQTTPQTGVQWYTINGIAPIHKSDAEIAAEVGAPAAHLAPTDNLRSGNQYASFRDIVFSPGSGPLTTPFGNPDPTEATRHATGKMLRFFVSDGTDVASAECFVKTVDEGFDSASGGFVFQPVFTDDFSTNSLNTVDALSGWSKFDFAVPSWSDSSYITTPNGAMVGSNWADATKFRASGTIANQDFWMPITTVGSDNYVRVKYYMYGGITGAGTAANLVPNIRLRAQTRFAVNSMLEVLAHSDSSDPGIHNYSEDFRPTTDAANPSLYRVDFAPINVPALYTLSFAGSFEGIQRAFEAYSTDPQDNGYIAMTESVMGTYPKTAIDDSTALYTKIYQTSASDSGDIKLFTGTTQWNPATSTLVPNCAVAVADLVLSTVNGQFAGTDTTSAQPTVTDVGTAGVTLDSSNVPSNRCGIVQVEWNPGADNTTHIRIDAGQQYKVKYHITSTHAANSNAQMRLRARTVKYQWTQKYEVGGAFNSGGFSNLEAQQALPGVGSLNPDQITPGENGGWYTLLAHTPMSADIRRDFPVGTPLTTSMPFITSQPGYGDAAASPGRDLRVGMDLVDTLSGAALATTEQGNFTIDRIEVRVFNLVDDGGY